MTTRVVLFNLETNMYLGESEVFTCVKDWRDARTFGSEGVAQMYLLHEKKICQANNLLNWCTRTFYSI